MWFPKKNVPEEMMHFKPIERLKKKLMLKKMLKKTEGNSLQEIKREQN